MDCDNARPTTLVAAKAIPDGYKLDPAQHALIAAISPIGISFASFLYENEIETGRLLEIPARFTDGDKPPTPPRQQLRGLVAAEPSGHRDRAADQAGTDLRFAARPLSEICHARGAQASGPSLIPARAPTSTASLPCTQKRVGAEASGDGIPPLLI